MKGKIILLILILVLQLDFLNLSIIPFSTIDNGVKLIQWLLLFIGVGGTILLHKTTKFDSFFIIIGWLISLLQTCR